MAGGDEYVVRRQVWQDLLVVKKMLMQVRELCSRGYYG
jgi:hypothetical protein